MSINDTERHVKAIKAKLSGLKLSTQQKTELAGEINQLSLTLIEMHRAQKAAK